VTGPADPAKPDAWVGRATPPPAKPSWPTEHTAEQPHYVPPPYPPAPPGFILVPNPALAAPPPRRRSGLRVFLIVVGVFAACCAGGATLALITTAALDGKGTFGSAPPGLNTPVEDGKFRFTVTSVSCGHDTVGSIVTRQAHGQYCIVDLSVTNVGTKGQLLLDSVQKAIGSDGAVYGPDSTAGVIASSGTSVWVNVVNPGSSVSGKIVFDIPDGASLAKLELHDSAFSTGTTVTL
jgi:Domain of unknown function (DUF4352)